MSNIINADNGVVSGIAGVKLSSDSTGVLDIQTNGTTAITISTAQVVSLTNSPTFTGGTANGVLYLNASKVATSGSALVFDGTNLGVGTASPAYKLDIAGNNYALRLAATTGTSRVAQFISNTSGQVSFGLESSAGGALFTGAGAYEGCIGTDVAKNFNIGTNGTVRATIDTSGNLGIGTASPASKLDVTGAFGTSTTAFTIYNNSAASASNIARIDFRVNNTFNGNERVAAVWGLNPNAAGNNGGALVFGVSANGTATTPSEVARFDQAGNLGIGTSSPWSQVSMSTPSGGTTGYFGVKDSVYGGDVRFGKASGVNNNGIAGTFSNNDFLFYTNSAERARFGSAGELLVGTTSALSSAGRFQVLGAATTSAANIQVGTNAYPAINFNNASGVQQGYIVTNAASVAYTSVSDYRLKNTIAPMTGALAKVALLKPCTYKWNADGSDGQGFIAHELAEVVPQCVTGEKDAVDAEGNPRYQGVDTSFLVATLTAAIQEQQAIITQLTARITALEGT